MTRAELVGQDRANTYGMAHPSLQSNGKRRATVQRCTIERWLVRARANGRDVHIADIYDLPEQAPDLALAA
jgi:hypothetical protein